MKDAESIWNAEKSEAFVERRGEHLECRGKEERLLKEKKFFWNAEESEAFVKEMKCFFVAEEIETFLKK